MKLKLKNLLKHRRLLCAVLFVVLVLITSIVSYLISQRSQQKPITNEVATDVTLDQPIDTPSEIQTDEKIEPVVNTLPDSVKITMWFASQAPYGDWSEPWQNACEEASIIIVRHYLISVPLDKDIMHNEILQLVDWQNQNWSGNNNLTSEETLLLAQSNYGLNGKVIYDYSVDQIKQYIVDGIPVIIPADGRLLGNPNFRNGGPEYHMLVIKGYNQTQFITNDPGTRKGENYLYTFDTIIKSIKNPAGGAKSVLVLYK